jgi:hypothetical protein
MSATKQKLLDYLDCLLTEANAVRSFRRARNYYDAEQTTKFYAKCRHLPSMLGEIIEPWRNELEMDWTSVDEPIDSTIGTVTAIRELVDGDLLIRVERLAEAEVFSDLLEQAEHLHEKGFYVAAAVLGRGVLEEHLRKWCAASNCLPVKSKPMLNDYNMALYPTHYDKTAMKHVDSMAAVGNEAAHNLKATKEDVERMLDDVRRFLALHPIT